MKQEILDENDQLSQTSQISQPNSHLFELEIELDN